VHSPTFERISIIHHRLKKEAVLRRNYDMLVLYANVLDFEVPGPINSQKQDMRYGFFKVIGLVV